jgi:hypothetical protein
MTIDHHTLCEDLRAWMKSPAIGLPEYSDDPVIQRRVGKILAETIDIYSRQTRTELMLVHGRAGPAARVAQVWMPNKLSQSLALGMLAVRARLNTPEQAGLSCSLLLTRQAMMRP